METVAAPWEPYKALARKRRQKRTSVPRHSVLDVYAPRSWTPEQICPEDRMEVVLLLLEDQGEMSQQEIIADLMKVCEITYEAAATNVTGALLALLKWEFIEWTGETRDRSKIFRLLPEYRV